MRFEMSPCLLACLLAVCDMIVVWCSRSSAGVSTAGLAGVHDEHAMIFVARLAFWARH
jgi:hypothetical protein